MAEIDRLKGLILLDFNANKRAYAEKVWNTWIRSPDNPVAELETRRRANLRLAQTSEILREAFQKREELSLRATGQSSTVKIPIISIPLQLRDAILVGPFILAFCALAIGIYTLRALRYAPSAKIPGKVVGGVPSFYAFYGFWPSVGKAFAYVLLLAPVGIFIFLLPFLVPEIWPAWELRAVLYFLASFVAFLFLVIPLYQIPNVIKMIEEGILIRALPTPSFPLIERDRSSQEPQIRTAAPAVAMVPGQFVGCWKIIANSPRVYFIRFEADGRYLLSDGKETFQVSASGDEFLWGKDKWSRQQGSGQTLIGEWGLSATF